MNSADVYASHELFAKLWPKLLRSTAVEAVAELQKDKPSVAAKLEAVKACIEDADKGKSSDQKVSERITLVTRETEGNLVYETRDKAAAPAPTAAAPATADAGWIHRNYLTKDEETKATLKAAAAARMNVVDAPRKNQRGGQQRRIEVNPNPAPANPPADEPRQQPANPPANR